MLETICVITCATQENQFFTNFQSSFKKHRGWDVHVLGMGRKWESFQTKMQCYHDFFKTVDKKQLVVCLDAYDVLCIRSSQDFRKKFLSYQVPIVVGYETACVMTISNPYFQIGNCPSIETWKTYHHMDKEKNIHVNTGCVMGYAGELETMFEWILKQNIKDDQMGVGFYMNHFPHMVQLDIAQKLIINDVCARTYSVENDPHGQIRMNGQYPYFAHFPSMHDSPPQNNYNWITHHLLQDNTYFKENKKTVSNMLLWILLGIGLVVLVSKNDFLTRKNKRNKNRTNHTNNFFLL
jgi:hypothetical protein